MDQTQFNTMLDALKAEVAKGQAANAGTLESMVTTLRKEMEAKFEEQKRLQAAFSVPGSADEKFKGEKFSFAKFYRGVWSGDWSGSQLEKAITDEATPKLRAMSVVPDSAGGFAVPTEIMLDAMIPLLYAKSIVAGLGATQLTGLTANPIKIPKVTGGTTAYWLSEAQTITASDLTLGQVTSTPKMLATVSAWSELLNMNQPAIEAMIRNDQALKMALKLDLAALTGSGASGEPLGLKNWTGVNTESIGASPTYDLLQNMIADVEGQNALEGNLGFATSVVMKKIIKQAKDVTGGTDNKSNIQPLGARELWNEQSKTICGYKQLATTQLGDNDLIFGNWADLVLLQWGGMLVNTSIEVGFLSGQRHLRTIMFCDSIVRQAKSFSVATA